MPRPLRLGRSLALSLALGLAACSREEAEEVAAPPAAAEPASEAPAAPSEVPPPVATRTDTSLSVEPPPDAPAALRRAADGSAGSCDGRPDRKSCTTYAGPAWGLSSAASQCGGQFIEAACPIEGRRATCAFNAQGDPAQLLVATFYEGADLETAERTCPGTFTRFE